MALNLERCLLEETEKWRDFAFKVPFIPFKKGWKVAPIPPFAGAMARFRVEVRPKRGKKPALVKSVYLDVDNSLGYWSEPPTPYWEVYPYRGDCGRCAMADVKELVKMIADTKDGE